MQTEFQKTIARFAAMTREVQACRKFLTSRFGLTDAQLDTLAQDRRGALETFARAAFTAQKRIRKL
jgi:hypothetical protein